MTSRSRTRAGALGLLLTAALLLTGCGGASPKAAGTSPSGPGTASAKTHGTVVKVTKYGISFELPQGWISLDAKQVLAMPNEVMDKLANRFGITTAKLRELFSRQIQTYSVTNQGMVDGFLDNANSVGVHIADVTDDQLKLGLIALRATIGTITHATSTVGPVTRVPYQISIEGHQVHATAIVVDTGDDIVTITIATHADQTTTAIADQIQSSLEWLDSTRKGNTGL